VRNFGWVQATDRGAPARHSDFAVELIYLSLEVSEPIERKSSTIVKYEWNAQPLKRSV